MSSLGTREKWLLEEFLGMGSGYVLDFSDRTFSEFCVDAVDVRHAIRALEQDGWRQVRMRGQFRHAEKPGTVTVAGKLGDDLARGTWNSIKRQARLKE